MKIKLFIICFFCWGCNIKFDGRPGVSVSMQDSIDRYVFWSEYDVVFIPVENHRIYFNYTEAWSERRWRYTKYFHSDTNIEEGFQLCIKVDNSTLDGIQDHWFIGRKRKEAIGQIGKDRIWISEVDIKEGDTIYYNVYRGDYRIDTSASLFIGKLEFIKKN